MDSRAHNRPLELSAALELLTLVWLTQRKEFLSTSQAGVLANKMAAKSDRAEERKQRSRALEQLIESSFLQLIS